MADATRLFALCALAILYCTVAQQCVQMKDKSYFAPCTAAGYTTTFPVPPNVSKRSLRWVGFYHKYLVNGVKNCSVAQIGEAIGCAMYAPYCREGSSEPLLPCRRICTEFLKRCEGSVPEWWIDDFIGRCVLLPDETAASGKCYEPPQFTDLHVTNGTGPFDRGCQKMVNFPFCENLGYQYTIATPENQVQAYRFFYKKNMTDGEPSKPHPSSILQRIMWTMGNNSKCALSIKRLFCGGVMQPCFPHEGTAYYTVCQGICRSIATDCPEILTSRGARYYVNCERYPDDVTAHGFCKHTKWPSPEYWKEFYPVQPTDKPKSDNTVLLVGVLVPVILVLVIVSAVILVLWKQNKLAAMFNYKKYQDEKPFSGQGLPPTSTA
ncbi:uncharacterized protein LOC5504811 [Nematostella vectensis]|uniref:uncharacterized protein LOC5504811 n=1 Tax=Nematostella vectensis TaxID=45351 RepID=UPI002077997A|nr:uncharacterized protein LOC5504811 [Nematostella vectensis]